MFWKKEFLKVSQNSKENTCARVSVLIKLQASASLINFCLRPATSVKNRHWYSCFPVNFVKVLRTPFSWNTFVSCFWPYDSECVYYPYVTFKFWIVNFNWQHREIFSRLLCVRGIQRKTGISTIFRSSHQRCSVRKGVLRNFAKFTGKRLCQSVFFNKVAGWILQLYLKRDSGTGVFLWICKISKAWFPTGRVFVVLVLTLRCSD